MIKQLAAAEGGDVAIIKPGRTNQVGAVKKLTGIKDAYLYVARTVNGTVLDQLRATEESVRDYRELNKRREGTELSLGLMYTTIALTLLLSSVRAGMWFANQLRGPHPPPDHSGPGRLARQSAPCRCRPPRRGRSRPPVDDLQPHDGRA